MQMDSGVERADPGDSEQDEEENVYEVDKIIDMRVEKVSADVYELASWLVPIMLARMPSC